MTDVSLILLDRVADWLTQSSLAGEDLETVVRGLCEREVTADTATLSIHMERSGPSPAAIFPALAAKQAQVQAFLAEEGIKEDEMQAGQWTTTRTSAQELKNDSSLPRYSVGGVIGTMRGPGMSRRSIASFASRSSSGCVTPAPTMSV